MPAEVTQTQSEKDLADRKRLFPGTQPEFVSDEALATARRKEQAPPKEEELPTATKYAHSKYLLRKAAEIGFTTEEAEEMSPQDLHEAIRTEALTARREGLSNQAAGGSSVPGTPGPAPTPGTPAAPPKDESSLDGIDLSQFDDVTQTVLKRLGQSLDAVTKQVRERDKTIEELRGVHTQAQQAQHFDWFHGACDKFPQLMKPDGTRDGIRRNAVYRVIEDLQAAGQHGKSLEEDLAKIVPQLFGAAPAGSGKPPAKQPTPTHPPTQRGGAEELDRVEKASQNVERYLAENNINLDDDAGPGPTPKKKFVP